ncbi:MAG: hypothetical protein AAGD28_31920, partial [Bacteroidota bacterium]
AQDRIFSGESGLSLADIQNSIEEFNRQIEADQIEEVPNFLDRSIIGFERVERLNFERFITERRIRFFPVLPPPPSVARNSLLITDLDVIEDPSRTYNVCTGAGTPMGAWTFGKLMTEMVNTPLTGVSASDFVKAWITTWTSDLTVHGDRLLEGFREEEVLNRWLTASSARGLPTGELDLSIAPFRLLAIVNRIDLRENPGYSSKNAGEARFVFGMIGTDGCEAIDHVTILEYGINKRGCTAVKSWGQQWYDLKDFELGSSDYNTRLQAITDQFSLANAAPSKPNGSAINQVRTNVRTGTFPFWDFREFHLNKDNHLLQNEFVAMTPQSDFQGGSNRRFIANFINENVRDILNKDYEVPETYAGRAFLGARAGLDGSSESGVAGFTWDGDVAWTATSPATQPGMVSSHKARHFFAINTCSGCHGLETNTLNPFHMVNFAPFGVQPSLAGFLTGVGGQLEDLVSGPTSQIHCAPDPVGRPVAGIDPCGDTPEIERGFNELNRRAQDLNTLVNTPCFPAFLRFRPLRMVH